MQHELAAHWNGPWQRPPWWERWQQDKHTLLASYRFNLPGQEPTGLLSLAVELHPTEGRQVVVHDFWAATDRAAAAMLAFLGRHNSSIGLGKDGVASSATSTRVSTWCGPAHYAVALTTTIECQYD